MKPYYDKDNITIYHGECLDVMQEMEDNSIDTIITDPPYALEFMGKGWDKVLPPVEIWIEALRVAKPGAMLMAFGGTRTYHRLVCSIEDAGWEIRDCVMWVYGSGFPKSHDISKAIDKAAGAERKVIGQYDSRNGYDGGQRKSKGTYEKHITGEKTYGPVDATTPATKSAKLWDGYGTALKPAWEPIVLAMKPLDGTFAQNALKWGVAGLWIDGGRIGTGQDRTAGGRGSESTTFLSPSEPKRYERPTGGRWPANLIHDGSEEVLGEFAKAGDRKAGSALSGKEPSRTGGPGTVAYGEFKERREWESYKDSGSAARFFYCAKASKAERAKGCESLPKKIGGMRSENSGQHITRRNGDDPEPVHNNHPTVKPVSLMRYLCRLTRMPDGGIIFDPFMGSGTTGIAAKLEGRRFIGIDRKQEYCEIARNRIEAWGKGKDVDDGQKGFDFE